MSEFSFTFGRNNAKKVDNPKYPVLAYIPVVIWSIVGEYAFGDPYEAARFLLKCTGSYEAYHNALSRVECPCLYGRSSGYGPGKDDRYKHPRCLCSKTYVGRIASFELLTSVFTPESFATFMSFYPEKWLPGCADYEFYVIMKSNDFSYYVFSECQPKTITKYLKIISKYMNARKKDDYSDLVKTLFANAYHVSIKKGKRVFVQLLGSIEFFSYGRRCDVRPKQWITSVISHKLYHRALFGYLLNVHSMNLPRLYDLISTYFGNIYVRQYTHAMINYTPKDGHWRNVILQMLDNRVCYEVIITMEIDDDDDESDRRITQQVIELVEDYKKNALA
jgi:hypothetical protein